MSHTTFWVPGKPIGQGAISYNPSGFGYHKNGKDLDAWRHNVGYCAKMARPPLLEGPVKLELRFVLLKPKTVKREWPTVAPDLDHYIRACGDALKSIAFLDDAQVCEVVASKVYGDTQGVAVTITSLQSV